MDDVIDLAGERALREAFRSEVNEGAEKFIAAIHQAARGSADVAWTLSTPVRSHEDLTRDINRLMMRRLRKELRFHVRQLTSRLDLKAAWTQLVCDFALSAFTSRMLELEEIERDNSNGSTSSPH